MTARILQGDCLDLLPTLARGSVDCVVTSPPFWALRSYLPKDHPLKARELGSEPTADLYVDALVRVFRLVRAVMADHATAWVDIGDTYGADGNLCLIPWRLALALQADGWVVRSVVAWVKPAPLPQSLSGWRWSRCRVKVKGGRQNGATKQAGHGRTAAGLNERYFGPPENSAQWVDCPGCPRCAAHAGYVLRRGSWRPTSSWEPVLLLAKQGGYYADGEAVKQPAKYGYREWSDVDANYGIAEGENRRGVTPSRRNGTVSGGGGPDAVANLRDVWTADPSKEDMLAALATRSEEELRDLLYPPDPNPPDVMKIAAEPLRAAHYAAMPTELVYRCLTAGTSAKGYCPRCSAPWCRVVEGGKPIGDMNPKDESMVNRTSWSGREWAAHHAEYPTNTVGWRATCPHGDLPPRPGLVLDPFAGSGRVGVQCQRMGLDFVGVELSPEYAEMARRLLAEASPLFGGVESP